MDLRSYVIKNLDYLDDFGEILRTAITRSKGDTESAANLANLLWDVTIIADRLEESDTEETLIAVADQLTMVSQQLNDWIHRHEERDVPRSISDVMFGFCDAVEHVTIAAMLARMMTLHGIMEL